MRSLELLGPNVKSITLPHTCHFPFIILEFSYVAEWPVTLAGTMAKVLLVPLHPL